MTVSVAVSAHGTVVPQANEEFTRRGGLLIPATTDLAVDQAVSRPEARPVDGYTAQVRELEAAAAEAERVRALPTQRVLTRRQELAEAAMLAELDTAEHVRQLRHQGVRETAQLGAAAEAAAGRRSLETDLNVRALQLARQRRRWTLICWAVLVLSMAFTCVNVQQFAAGSAPAWSAQWLVAWGVDPLLSALVIGLLLSRGDLAATGAPMSQSAGRSRHVILGIELGALGAALLMNVAPELAKPDVRWQDVALHIVVPLAGMAAAVVLPIVQGFYTAAITGLTAVAGTAGNSGNTPPRGGGPRVLGTTGTTGTTGTSADQVLMARARAAIALGELPALPSRREIQRVLKVRAASAQAVKTALGEETVPHTAVEAAS